MAGYSALPAMDVDPIGFGARNLAATAQGLSAMQDYNLKKSLLPDMEAAQRATLQATTEQAPLEIQSKRIAVAEQGQEQQLKTQQYGNQTLAQVAMDARAADPEEAPDVWDEGMKKAAAAGITQASQYIGHYRPDLAQNVSDVYGGPSGTKADRAQGQTIGQDPEQIARAVGSMPVPQLRQAYSNLNKAITSFNGVKDKASWDAEMQDLKEAGIDVAKFLPSTDYNAMNYAAAKRAIDRLVPMRDAMADRVLTLSAGGPEVSAKPLGTSTYVGVDQRTGKPIYHNSTTGQDTIGDTPIGPKPTAGVATMMYKQQAWLQIHPGDNQGALDYANGKKNLSPAQMMQSATDLANKRLSDEVLAGATIPDPDQWVKQETANIYKQLSAATSPAPQAHTQPGAQLPQRALDALKKANGQPVRFQNGMVYKMGADGKPVRVS